MIVVRKYVKFDEEKDMRSSLEWELRITGERTSYSKGGGLIWASRGHGLGTCIGEDNVEKFNKKVSVWFFLGQIEKIRISTSTNNLDVVKLCEMALVTHLFQ